MTKFVFYRPAKVGKEEKCWLAAFSPFPTMFFKDFLLGPLKVRII